MNWNSRSAGCTVRTDVFVTSYWQGMSPVNRRRPTSWVGLKFTLCWMFQYQFCETPGASTVVPTSAVRLGQQHGRAQ